MGFLYVLTVEICEFLPRPLDFLIVKRWLLPWQPKAVCVSISLQGFNASFPVITVPTRGLVVSASASVLADRDFGARQGLTKVL